MTNAQLTSTKAKKTGTAKAVSIIMLLGVLLTLALIVSVNAGYTPLSPLDILRIFFGGGTHNENLILFDFRLPRIVIALLIGFGLAVSGCILQGITRNALADPGILGINSGAGLFVLLYVLFFPTTRIAPIFTLPILAFVGASLTALLIYSLAYRKSGMSPIQLILSGIAIDFGIRAFTIVMTLGLNPEKFLFVQQWNAGSIWGANWKFVLALLPWIVVLVPYALYKARSLNVLNLGENIASGLGASVNRERLKLLGVAVGLAGACVAVSGIIGFVGLISPHLARRLVGSRHELLLPASALLGALLIVVADALGRWIFQPGDIPTGISVAVIGAPYFLYLLARTKN